MSTAHCVSVCLLRRLPAAKFGRQKVAVTHLCTFDRHFRMVEPRRTVMDNDEALSDEKNCKLLMQCQVVLGMPTQKSSMPSWKALLVKCQVCWVEYLWFQTPSILATWWMKYKGLIIIEGNNVASGLKWALLLQSVVLIAPPKYTSWAMEKLLKSYFLDLILLCWWYN